MSVGFKKMPQTSRETRGPNAAAVIKFQSSPVTVLSVKEDRNIYLNGNRFLVRVSSISDFIFQVAHTLSAHLELKSGRLGRDRMAVGFTTTCAIMFPAPIQLTATI